METFILLLELAGTMAFAASGAMTGLKKNMDIFGVCILGLTTAGIRIAYAQAARPTLFLLVFVGVVTGVGGGVLRDVMAGDTPYIFVKHVYASASLLPQLQVDFRRARPDIRFEIVQRIFQDTEQPEYDMLIDSIVGDEVLPRSSCLLIQEEVLLAVQSGHPLTGKDGISLSDIREEPFVSLRRDRPWARIIQKACSEVNFTPSIVAESDNPITLCDFVRCGLGVCFLPSRTGLPPAGEGITLLRLKDFAYTRHLYLHWCYNAFLPPHVDAFRQFALAWFAQIEDRGPLRT